MLPLDSFINKKTSVFFFVSNFFQLIVATLFVNQIPVELSTIKLTSNFYVDSES